MNSKSRIEGFKSQWYYSDEILSGPLLAVNSEGFIALIVKKYLINIFMLLEEITT